MRVGLLAMSGVRAHDAELTALGLTLPGFVDNRHIGFFPPVNGDARLEKAVSKYAGEKGTLRFPLDEPIPYRLITRIVKHRVKQNLAKPAAKRRKRA
ncbi:MAG: hypothetical protein JJE51_06675 [Thermoanaerobaculia bacterium]|nr:hypothetical protein [Thermoanaerobaculia bacterium]